MNKTERDWQVAYLWLCQRQRDAPPNADCWHLRFHWQKYGEPLYRQVRGGHYRLPPMQVHRQHDRSWVQWSAQDALVLKWVTLQVEHLLPMQQRCVHLKGRGGWQAVGRAGLASAHLGRVRLCVSHGYPPRLCA